MVRYAVLRRLDLLTHTRLRCGRITTAGRGPRSGRGAGRRVRRGCRLPTAIRSTWPLIGALIVDSIFIASITATGSPAATCCPAATWTITAPITGAATWPGFCGSARSICGPRRPDRAVADVERPQLPVDARHHGPHAVLVGLADRLELEDHAHAGREVDRQRLVLAQAVEERGRRQQRDVAVALARGLVVRVAGPGRGSARARPGARRPAPPSAASVLGASGGARRRRRAARERAGGERLREPVGRLAEPAAEEVEHASRAGRSAPDRARARRGRCRPTRR